MEGGFEAWENVFSKEFDEISGSERLAEIVLCERERERERGGGGERLSATATSEKRVRRWERSRRTCIPEERESSRADC